MALVATMMASPLVAAPDSTPTPTPKPKANTSASSASRVDTVKMSGKMTTLGKDAKGRTILKNERGETFYLEPGTGKMVFVKWPAAKAPASQKK